MLIKKSIYKIILFIYVFIIPFYALLPLKKTVLFFPLVAFVLFRDFSLNTQIFKNKTHRSLIIFFVAVCASALVAADKSLAIQLILSYLQYFMVYFIIIKLSLS